MVRCGADCFSLRLHAGAYTEQYSYVVAMDSRKNNAASDSSIVPRSTAIESRSATNEMTPAVTAKLPTLPVVPSFLEVDKVNRQHGGLLGLSQASDLVKDGSADDVSVVFAQPHIGTAFCTMLPWLRTWLLWYS